MQLTTLTDFLVAIVLCGGFGGLLFGHRQTGLSLPYYDRAQRRWSSGFLADIAFGVAGGLVVFLIVPADFSTSASTEKTVKFLGLCVLGGYAGPALLEKIIKETLKDIRKEQVEIKGKIAQQEKLTSQNIALQEHDQNAICVVDDYINDTENQNITSKEVRDAVAKASTGVRFEIYQRTRSVRRKSWQTDKAAVGRTVEVFEALAAAGLPDRERHRLLAQLAYALKDAEPPDYERAADLLDEAIQLREREALLPSAWYHFNRAFCCIKLVDEGRRADSPAQARQIADDLGIAEKNPTMAEAVRSSDIVQRWIVRHPLSPTRPIAP